MIELILVFLDLILVVPADVGIVHVRLILLHVEEVFDRLLVKLGHEGRRDPLFLIVLDLDSLEVRMRDDIPPVVL